MRFKLTKLTTLLSLTVAMLLVGCTTSIDNSDSNLKDPLRSCTGFAISVDDFQKSSEHLTIEQWEEIFDSFETNGLKGQPVFEEKLRYLAKHPKHMVGILKNAEPYIYSIYREAVKTCLPSEILIIPMIESMYRTNARSPAGYVGIWQFGVQTARNFGLKVDKKVDERTDFRKSSSAAIGYLAYLNKLFSGNWQLAISGYNAGEGRVQQSVKKMNIPVSKIDFRKLNIPAHTKNYLYTIYAYAYYLKHYKEYNGKLLVGFNKTIKDKLPTSKILYVSKEQFADFNKVSLSELESMDLVVQKMHKNKETLCNVYVRENYESTDPKKLAKASRAPIVKLEEMADFSNIEYQVIGVVQNVDLVKNQRLKPMGVRGKNLDKYVVKESIYDEDAYFKALQRMIEEDLSST